MAAYVGRSVIMEWGGDEIPGVREKGVKLDGTPVDVTSDEDGGWATLLTVAGENKVEISISGVTKSPHLKADWFAGTRTKTLTLTYPDGRELSGSFFLSSFTEKKPYKDASTFEAVLMSSGMVAFTPYS